MTNRIYIALYFLVLLADLLAITFHQPGLRYITKPLLTIVLAVYFMAGTRQVQPIFRALLGMALAFSCMGDVLLLFPGQRFFLAGLGAFLLAHLSYIGFFLKIRYSNHPLVLCRYPFIFLTEAVVLAFIFFMLPYLEGMRLPVIIYAIAISFTLLTSMHAFRLGEQPAGWLCVCGAILFIVSDGLIAVQHFYRPVPGGNLLVMLTYGLAQCGLVTGGYAYFTTACRYGLRRANTN